MNQNHKNIRPWAVATVVAATAILTLLPCRAGAAVFSDGTFNDADWTTTVLTFGAGGGSSTAQVASGGNTGAYRQTGMSVNTVGEDGNWAGVCVISLRDDAVYDPAAQGAVASVKITIDLMADTEELPSGVADGVSLAMEQSGIIYVAYHMAIPTEEWVTNGPVEDEYADVFWPWPGNGDQVDMHPDFSASGAPITFGYYWTLTNLSQEHGGNVTTGIDNWIVEVTPVPEPVTLSLLAFGGLALLKGRNGSASRRG